MGPQEYADARTMQVCISDIILGCVTPPLDGIAPTRLPVDPHPEFRNTRGGVGRRGGAGSPPTLIVNDSPPANIGAQGQYMGPGPGVQAGAGAPTPNRK